MNYAVLSLIILIIIKCDADAITKGNPHIVFTRFSASTLEQAARYTVLMNKSLQIDFNNMSISRGWCFNYYNHDKKLDEWEPPIYKDAYLHFKRVSPDMSILWKCNVTEMKNQVMHNDTMFFSEITDLLYVTRPKYQVFYLNLHVKGAKSVKMYINGQELIFSKADLSVPYDGHADYFYDDGKHIQIVCRNLQKTGTVHLEYFTKGATNVSDPMTLDIQLHLGSNRSYIDCVYTINEPPDKYVYRVTFIIKKPPFYFNESKTQIDAKISASPDTKVNFSPILLGGSIGAVLLVLGVIGAVCCFVRIRKAKYIETPYEDVSNQTDNQMPQHTNESENQYDLCHYSDRLSIKETYYNTPEGVENVDPKDHYYTEIVYFACKVKIDEPQTRNSRVYDEPYVEITISK